MRTITLTDSQKSLVNTLPSQYIDLDLGDTCNVVLAYILSKAQDNIAMLTHSEIMENTGFSKPTLTKVFKQITDNGIVERVIGKKGCPSIYRFVSLPNDTLPNNKVNNDTLPNDTLPNDKVNNDTLPNNKVNNDTLPNNKVNNDTLPNNTLPNDSTSNDSTSNDSTSNDSTSNNKVNLPNDDDYDDYDMYHDAPQDEPLTDEPQNDDEYDDYELYHPNETTSPNSEYDDDPEPTPVEPNYNVNPWDDEPYNKYLDEKEAWERRQKEKAQPKYNFSLWGKLLAIRDFDTNRIEGFYFYTYEGLERAEDFGKAYHSPILRKLPTHALMDQCVKGNGEFGVLSCYDNNFTFSERNEKPSWVTNKV